MHPTDAELRALVDEQVPGVTAATLEAHLAECSRCAGRRSAMLGEVAETARLLAIVAPQPLALDVDAVILAATRTPRRRPAMIAAAASVLLVAVAAATVGRPAMNALLARVRAGRRPPAQVATPVRAPATGSQSGVALVPARDAIVRLTSDQTAGVLRVAIVPDSELSVSASAPVAFRVLANQVEVRNDGSSASYDLRIPRHLDRVRIIIAGHLVFERTGGLVRTGVPADEAGRYSIPVR